MNSAYAAGFVVTAYEIDFFGRIASLKEQALAQYLATAEGSQSARNRFTRGRVSRKLHHHSNSSFRIAYLRWRHIAAYRLNRT